MKTLTTKQAITAREINELLEIEDFAGIIFRMWGADGLSVIEEIENSVPYSYGFKEFLTHCACMGGDWGNMLLSGVKELYPSVWKAIPEEMGNWAFVGITSVLNLLGIDTSKES